MVTSRVGRARALAGSPTPLGDCREHRQLGRVLGMPGRANSEVETVEEERQSQAHEQAERGGEAEPRGSGTRTRAYLAEGKEELAVKQPSTASPAAAKEKERPKAQPVHEAMGEKVFSSLLELMVTPV